jgi:hypothetical protein
MTGKNYAAGMIVPDGVFGNLAEMVKAGDIGEAEVVLEIKNENGIFEPVVGIDDEAIGEEFKLEEIKEIVPDKYFEGITGNVELVEDQNTIEDEGAETDQTEAKKAENARKARERRAAAKAGN